MSKIQVYSRDKNDCTLLKISPLNTINFRYLSSCFAQSKFQRFATLAARYDIIITHFSTVHVHAIPTGIPI